MITWITVSSSMIGRICGTSTRSCRLHQPAPSMRAASAVSGGNASSAAVKTTTPKPSCCQTTSPPTETIARCELPSQSWASAPRCDVAERRVEHAVLLQQERERDADRGRRQHVGQEDDRLVVAPPADAVVEHERDREPEPEHHRHRQQQLQVVEQRLAELRVRRARPGSCRGRPRSASRSCPRRSCRGRPARAGSRTRTPSRRRRAVRRGTARAPAAGVAAGGWLCVLAYCALSPRWPTSSSSGTRPGAGLFHFVSSLSQSLTASAGVPEPDVISSPAARSALPSTCGGTKFSGQTETGDWSSSAASSRSGRSRATPGSACRPGTRRSPCTRP